MYVCTILNSHNRWMEWYRKGSEERHLYHKNSSALQHSIAWGNAPDGAHPVVGPDRIL